MQRCSAESTTFVDSVVEDVGSAVPISTIDVVVFSGARVAVSEHDATTAPSITIAAKPIDHSPRRVRPVGIRTEWNIVPDPLVGSALIVLTPDGPSGSVWLHALSAVEGFTNDVGMPRVARSLLDQVQQHPAQVLINKVVTGTPIIEWHLGCDLLGYRNLVGVSTQPMGDSVVVVDDEVLGRIRLDVRPLASPATMI